MEEGVVFDIMIVIVDHKDFDRIEKYFVEYF